MRLYRGPVVLRGLPLADGALVTAIDTTTSLDIELAEWLDRPWICEPAVGTCDREAAWWLVLSCGHTFAACSPCKEQQDDYLSVMRGLVDCLVDKQIVTWRWEPNS